MLTISTIPEALAELSKHTGRAWTDSELFDVATTRDIKLHAAPPITAQTTIQEFVIGEGLKEKFRSSPGHAMLAVLFPWQVQQLWIGGETATSHPNEYKVEGEYHFFTEPVKVTREQVRISAQSLGKILNAWNNAQAGRWIVDTAQPGGMRCQNGPNWMFPTDAPAAKGEAGADTSPSGDDVDDDDDGNWIVKCPAIAQKLGEKQLKTTGAQQINASSMSEEVAEELALDPTTHGRQGPRGAHTVRTEGLKGWKFRPPEIVKK
ncbi:MAG: hypothetical protein Q7J38_05540 [Gallionella sp.]|nr:hypothetical protein [Gallionella sp.]